MSFLLALLYLDVTLGVLSRLALREWSSSRASPIACSSVDELDIESLISAVMSPLKSDRRLAASTVCSNPCSECILERYDFGLNTCCNPGYVGSHRVDDLLGTRRTDAANLILCVG